MNFTAISDTHTYHNEVIIEPTDVLIHAGDFSFQGKLTETISFLKWFETQPAKYRVFCSGNHDRMDETESGLFKELLKEHAPTVNYLRDEGMEIDGIKLWGSPWTPRYGDWAFMVDPGSPQVEAILKVIPNDTDVLITHGPPYGHLDRVKNGPPLGSMDLLHRVVEIQPSYHIFGHIHDQGGKMLNHGGTIFVNASSMNEQYKVVNKPVTFAFKP